MRALVYHGPWQIAVEEVDDPEPGPGEALLEVRAAGICGSDLHGFTGHTGRRSPGQIMGHEVVGRIRGLGPAIGETELRPGLLAAVNPVIGCGRCASCNAGTPQQCPDRRVIGVTPDLRSAFAELMVAPASNVIVLGDDTPEEHGALVEPLAVGYHAARRGGCTCADRVLIVGGGPIGQACLLAARRCGARSIVVSEPNAARRELLQRLGATVIDPSADGIVERSRALLEGPATLVLDAVGSSSTLADALRASGLGGRVVLVGMNEPSVTLAAFAVSTEERTVIGSFCYSPTDFADTAAWVSTNPPELAELIEGRVDMYGAVSMFTELAAGRACESKVLLHPQGLTEAHA